ncbi:MAG: hypothetical protein IKJ77_06695 [Firmicutes bacterium]|nr:hypothetical protein [Bacillota bacterium]
MENKTKGKIDYIQLVSEKANREYADVEAEMIETRDTCGVTFREFYRYQLWEHSMTQKQIISRKILRVRNRKSESTRIVAEALGIPKKDVKNVIKQINDKGIFLMDVNIYAVFELFRYKEEELDEVLHKFARRKELRASLQEKFVAIDAGDLTYADLEEEVEELYDFYREMMPESLYNTLWEKLSYSRPDLAEDKEQQREALVDMAVTKYLLQFSEAEYVSFHFVGKTIEEKREFLSDVERMRIIKTLNRWDCFDHLDDKFLTYSRLKKYYRRKALFVTSKEDYDKFKWFCLGKKTVVIKPYSESMGRGIRPLQLKGKKSRKKQFEKLCAEYDSFIVEDLIKPHETIRALNPDSVNTVRVVTYFDGRKTIIHDTFMKVGKKGSFVDNGGAGGIFVSVNPETGTFKSAGCDENGVVYETHPDTGIRFNGYQLPDWKQARKLAMKLSTKVPGINYIGWDFTYTEKGKWIIVEGNAKTQFFGQQCTTGVGLRKSVMETLHYDPVTGTSKK